MKLLVLPGAGSPENIHYQAVYETLEKLAKQSGYRFVDTSLRWPGQMSKSGVFSKNWFERKKALTLGDALNVAIQKVKVWEQEGEDYHILCRSFGTLVGLKLAVDMELECLKRIILWGVFPYWVAWKYGVKNLETFRQEAGEKGTRIDETYFASLEPVEVMLEEVEVATVIAAGEKDIYCPQSFWTYLREMFGDKDNLYFPQIVSGASHEVIASELPEKVVGDYRKALFG